MRLLWRNHGLARTTFAFESTGSETFERIERRFPREHVFGRAVEILYAPGWEDVMDRRELFSVFFSEAYLDVFDTETDR